MTSYLSGRFGGELGMVLRVLLVACLTVTASVAAGDRLLHPAGGLSDEERLELDADRSVTRWRVARMDSNEAFRSRPGAAPLVFNLFHDTELLAHVNVSRNLGKGSSFLAGTLIGGGHFTLFRHHTGIVRGEFHAPQGFFSLRAGDAGRALVRQMASSLLRCGVEGPGIRALGLPVKTAGLHLPATPIKGPRPSAALGSMGDGSGLGKRSTRESGRGVGKTIDVLVLYTQRVEKYEGGRSAVRSLLDYEMAKANHVLENSGLAHRRLRLADAILVDYASTGSMEYDHRVLANTGRRNPDSSFGGEFFAGGLRDLPELVEESGADLVHLFVRDIEGVHCGFAGIPSDFPELLEDSCSESGLRTTTEIGYDKLFTPRIKGDSTGLCRYNTRRALVSLHRYSVGSVKCGGTVFAHELGHSLSLRHTRDDYADSREFGDLRWSPFHSYGYGYYDPNMGRRGGTCFSAATVMYSAVTSRPEGCDSFVAYGLPYFSNHELNFPEPSTWWAGEYRTAWRADTPMGVSGERRTYDPQGPVSAARSLDEVWDIVADLSEDPLARLPDACNEGDLAGGLLQTQLPASLDLSFPGGARMLSVSLSGAPAECVDDVALIGRALGAKVQSGLYAPRRLMAWPDEAQFGMSMAGSLIGMRQRLEVFAKEDHYGVCSVVRRAVAVVEATDTVQVDGERIVQRVPGTVRHGMALAQGAAHSFCVGSPARQLRRMGDFNGDGKADMLLRHVDGSWLYYPLDGPSLLPGGAANLPGNPAVSVAGVGDFNGDGKDDVLMRLASGSWRYYPMDGRDVLPGRGEVALPTDLAWEVEGIGDFNGDGKDDVLMRRLDGEWTFYQEFDQYADDWRYFAMDGPTVLGEGSPAGLSSERTVATWVAGIGDFNGDGNDDTLLRRIDGTWHYFPWAFYGPDYRQGGLFRGHGPVGLPDDLAWTAAGIADFDGDGKDDVLLRHEDGRWQYRLMDGRDVLAEGEPDAAALPDDPMVWLAGVGDMDGDGKAEVLTRHGHGAWRYSTWDAASGALVLGGEVALASDPAWGVLKGGVVDPPRVSAAIPDQTVATEGIVTVDLAEYFSDGEPLAFSAMSSDEEVVGATVMGSVLTLTAVADGRATVTVVARDVDGRLAMQRLEVVVSASGVAGRRFQDCPECPEMVVVPAGSFMQGAPVEEEGSDPTERPVHQVDFATPFAIGTYEVTFEQWDACVAAGGCGGYEPWTYHVGSSRASRPVRELSWHDAQAYVAWLSDHTGEAYRLPSESEWEYAARAGTTTPFHFGETISTDQAAYDGSIAYGDGTVGETPLHTSPVGSFPANAWGLHDVHGNVYEWTLDCREWDGDYADAPTDGGASEAGDCDFRSTRGGWFYSPPAEVRSAHRRLGTPDHRDGTAGIRVVRTYGDPPASAVETPDAQ